VKAGLARATDNRDPWSWYPALEAVKAEAASGRTFEAFDLEERYGVNAGPPKPLGCPVQLRSRAGTHRVRRLRQVASTEPVRWSLPHMAGCSPVTPTEQVAAREIADLMQSMPGPGAPTGERAAWSARKHELLARIEEAKR